MPTARGVVTAATISLGFAATGAAITGLGVAEDILLESTPHLAPLGEILRGAKLGTAVGSTMCIIWGLADFAESDMWKAINNSRRRRALGALIAGGLILAGATSLLKSQPLPVPPEVTLIPVPSRANADANMTQRKLNEEANKIGARL